MFTGVIAVFHQYFPACRRIRRRQRDCVWASTRHVTLAPKRWLGLIGLLESRQRRGLQPPLDRKFPHLPGLYQTAEQLAIRDFAMFVSLLCHQAALSDAANGLMTVTEKVHSLTLLQLPRHHFNPWQFPHGDDGFDEHVFLVLAECLQVAIFKINHGFQALAGLKIGAK